MKLLVDENLAPRLADELGETWGAPPKVILLQTGNCSTTQIERIIRANAIRFSDFESDTRRSLLVLK